MKIKASSLEKGNFMLFDQKPFVVVERTFFNPGKGSAFVHLKIRNIQTNQTLSPSVKSQEEIELIDVNEVGAQYLYGDAQEIHFMNQENFEQFSLPREQFKESLDFMSEGADYRVVFWESLPIEIILPPKVTLLVTEAEHSIKGNTVTNAMKNATLETGAVIRVPLFVKDGDKIVINTEKREYVERA